MFQDDISIQRLETFHPEFRRWIKEHYLIANNKLLPKGYRLRITAVYRTDAEQNYEYSKGRTIKGSIVTSAKAGQSIHNYGLAFDFVILRDYDGDEKFETAEYKVDKYWMRIVYYFKSIGFTWGGDFKKMYDPPHLEYSKGKDYKYFQSLKSYLYNGKRYPILPDTFLK